MGPICEVAGPIGEDVGNGDIFKGAMESDPNSPRFTCGVPLTTLGPFSGSCFMLNSDRSKLQRGPG